jgi:hypothetical protein
MSALHEASILGVVESHEHMSVMLYMCCLYTSLVESCSDYERQVAMLHGLAFRLAEHTHALQTTTTTTTTQANVTEINELAVSCTLACICIVASSLSVHHTRVAQWREYDCESDHAFLWLKAILLCIKYSGHSLLAMRTRWCRVRCAIQALDSTCSQLCQVLGAPTLSESVSEAELTHAMVEMYVSVCDRAASCKVDHRQQQQHHLPLAQIESCTIDNSRIEQECLLHIVSLLSCVLPAAICYNQVVCTHLWKYVLRGEAYLIVTVLRICRM